MIRPAVPASWGVTIVLPLRLGRQVLSLLMFIFPRNGMWVLQKEKPTHLKGTGRIHSCKSSLVNALRKGGQGLSQVWARTVNFF